MQNQKVKGTRRTIEILYRLTGSMLMKLAERQGVTVVNYHNPSPEIFEAHMKLFARYFCFVGVDYLVHRSSTKTNPMFVTIDDGYAGNYLLLDTIRRYNIPLMIYVVANHIDTHSKYWFDVIDHGSELMKTLKSISDIERRLLLKEKFGYECDTEFSERTAMNSRELKTILSVGCSIGSHTLSHPILTQCKKNAARNEIAESRKLLSEKLDIEVKHFAYPNGTWNLEVASFVESAGYETARTISPGLFESGKCLFQIPCYGISDIASPGKALLQATGFWSFSKRQLRKTSV